MTDTHPTPRCDCPEQNRRDWCNVCDSERFASQSRVVRDYPPFAS